MSYVVYKLMHFFGIFTLIVALAATAMHVLRGGTRADNPHRGSLAAAHGISLLLILTGGFGMLARMGVMHTGLPNWIYAKLVIWLAFGGAMTLAYRGKGPSKTVLFAIPVLGVLAAVVALYKPF
jgi:hypothetical protein